MTGCAEAQRLWLLIDAALDELRQADSVKNREAVRGALEVFFMHRNHNGGWHQPCLDCKQERRNGRH